MLNSIRVTTPAQHFAAYEALTYAGAMLIDSIETHCFSVNGTTDSMITVSVPFESSYAPTPLSVKLNQREFFWSNDFSNIAKKTDHVSCTASIECIDQRNKIHAEVFDALNKLRDFTQEATSRS
jgi:hypothetical protein